MRAREKQRGGARTEAEEAGEVCRGERRRTGSAADAGARRTDQEAARENTGRGRGEGWRRKPQREGDRQGHGAGGRPPRQQHAAKDRRPASVGRRLLVAAARRWARRPRPSDCAPRARRRGLRRGAGPRPSEFSRTRGGRVGPQAGPAPIACWPLCQLDSPADKPSAERRQPTPRSSPTMMAGRMPALGRSLIRPRGQLAHRHAAER